MRSIQDITAIQNLRNILQSHGRAVIDDGRTITLMNRSTNGITRFRKVSEAASSVINVVNDDRLKQFV